MKKSFLALFCMFSCLTVPSVTEAAWQPQLSVGLASGQEVVTVKVSGKCRILAEGENKSSVEVPAGSQLSITHNGTHFLVNGKKIKTEGRGLVVAAESSKAQNAFFTFGHNDYRGAAKIIVRHGKLTLINLLDTEDYLKGVVPEEMPTEWPAEAIKSQAVAARTYALQNRKRHENEGFDLCTNTHCQQYLGKRSEKSAANKAIEDTSGEVLTYQGKLIDALFHTDSGGMTENSEDVWGSKLPYLRAVDEKDTYTKPWKNVFTAERVASLVGKQSHKDIGSLKKIELSSLKIGHADKDRSASGRVRQAIFVGSKGRAAVSGNDLRNLLGLRSTLFDLQLNHKQVTIEGYGWGHGLGLSQWGAKKWAESGKGYREILSHYYQHTELKKLY